MKRFIWRFSLALLLPIGTVALIGDFCHKQTHGFRLQNLRPLTREPGLSPPLSPQEKSELELILSQPFSFLKKGQQCIAFSSQDDLYVLKLLRWDKLELSYFDRLLPNSWTEKKKQALLDKKIQDFTSYEIALDDLKEETGLLYLCLGTDGPLETTLTLYDPLGIQHTLHTRDTPFILQRKVRPLALSWDKEEELQPLLLTLLNQIQVRLQKAISDSDISLEHNIGIFEGKPVLFDIGNLKRSPSSLEAETRLIRSTLDQQSPSLARFFHRALNDKALEKDQKAPSP